ncbi:unnamed protein product [Closterium sp. NIES-54]
MLQTLGQQEWRALWLPGPYPWTTRVTGSTANPERQEQRTHRPLAQQARWATGDCSLRTTGAAGDTTATSAQPPPTVPPPFHTPLASPLAPLPRHPPSTTPSAPTHPPPSAAATAVGDGGGGGGGAGDGSHTRHPHTLPPLLHL